MDEKTLSEEELIHFARIGIQVMELKFEFARNTHLIALGEWARMYGIDTLKNCKTLIQKLREDTTPGIKPNTALTDMEYMIVEALMAIPKEADYGGR